MGSALSQLIQNVGKDGKWTQENIQDILDSLNQLEKQLEANSVNAAFRQELVQRLLDENLKLKSLTNSEESLVTRNKSKTEAFERHSEGAVVQLEPCSEHRHDMTLREALEQSKYCNLTEVEGIHIGFKRLKRQFEEYASKCPSKAETKGRSETLYRGEEEYKQVKALTANEKSYKKNNSDLNSDICSINDVQQELKKRESNVGEKHAKPMKAIRDVPEAKIQALEIEKSKLDESEENSKNGILHLYENKQELQNELQSSVNEHTTEKQNQQDKIKDLQNEIESLTKRHYAEIQNHKHEINKLKDENKTLIDELESKIKKNKHKNKGLQVQIKNNNNRFEEKTKEHVIDIEHCEQKFKELEKKNMKIIQTYTNELTHIEEAKEKQQKQLQQDIDKLSRDVLQQSEELEIYKKQIHFPAALQIYCPPRGDMTSHLHEGIKHLITDKFSDLRLDLSLKICEDVKDVVDYKPALVLCLNSSRIGTDVSRALEGLKATSLKSVVVIHTKEQRSLPRQATKDVLSGALYRSLGGIYDMAFLSERGYYACDMNNKAVNNIVEFVRNILTGFE